MPDPHVVAMGLAISMPRAAKSFFKASFDFSVPSSSVSSVYGMLKLPGM